MWRFSVGSNTVRTYALAPLTPQVWGEQDLTPLRFGGLGGLIGGYCVSPDSLSGEGERSKGKGERSEDFFLFPLPLLLFP